MSSELMQQNEMQGDAFFFTENNDVIRAYAAK
jgi:hypothetical protein